MKFRIYPRQYLLLALVLVAECSPVFAALWDNLRSYYNFEQTSGSLVDSLGNNAGTNHGADYSATGKVGYGWDFESGDSDYVDVNDDAVLGAGVSAFTVSAWYKPESVGADRVIWNYMRPESTSYGMGNMFAASDNKLYCRSVTTAHALKQAVSTTTVSAGNWYHVACVYNGTHLAIWVNGALEGVAAMTGNTDDYTSKHDIGRGYWGDAAQQYADGIIDELGIWTAAKTSSEIASLYNSGNGYTFVNQYNATNIFDNTTTHFYLNNTYQILNFTAYNGTNSPIPEILTLNITGLNGTSNWIQNLTAFKGINISFNGTVNNYTALVYPFYNLTGLNKTYYFYTGGMSSWTKNYTQNNVLNIPTNINASLSGMTFPVGTTFHNYTVWNGTLTQGHNLVSLVSSLPIGTWNTTITFTHYTNYSFGGENLTFDTGSLTQTWYNIYVTSNCSSGTNFLNLTIRDEESTSPVINATVNTELTLTDIGITFNLTDTPATNINLTYGFVKYCLYTAPNTNLTVRMTTQYYATNYATRYYYLCNVALNSSGVTNRNIYLLDSTGENFQWILKDNLNNYLPNYLIDIARYYPASNPNYQTVTGAKTDYQGNAITNVDPSAYYKLYIYDDDCNFVYATSGQGQRFTSDLSPQTISISTINQSSYWTNVGGISYNTTWNNVTGIYQVYVTSVNGLMNSFTLYAYNRTSLTETLYCNSTVSGSNSVNTYCTLPNSNITEYFIKGVVVFNDDSTHLLFTDLVGGTSLGIELGGRNGLLWSALIIMGILLLGISTGNVLVTLMLPSVALILLFFVGMVELPILALSEFAVLGLLSVYILGGRR